MSYWDGSDNQPYSNEDPNHYTPWHHMVNATHRAVSGVVNLVKKVAGKPAWSAGPAMQLGLKGAQHAPSTDQGGAVVTGHGYTPPGDPGFAKAKAASGTTKPSAWHLPGLGTSGGKSPAAPQHPVSHPGTSATHVPIKAAVGNRGHATVHPPKPHTAPLHPARHSRPPHAVGKATGGTQHTHSSGPAAGHPHPKKPKTKLHHHKLKKHHKVKKPKKPKS